MSIARACRYLPEFFIQAGGPGAGEQLTGRAGGKPVLVKVVSPDKKRRGLSLSAARHARSIFYRILSEIHDQMSIYFKARIKKMSKQIQQKMEEISGNVHEKLGGISVIQAYTREKNEEMIFLQDNREYLSFQMKNINNNAVAHSVIGFLTYLAPVLVVWYRAVQVLNHYLTIGELTAFYAYPGLFYVPLNRLTELNILLANSQAAIERIFEVFNTSPEIIHASGARELGAVKGEIHFVNVGFSYQPPAPTLKNINLSIPAGCTVALVSPSSAGKSTCVKLIPRFYDVSEGLITIDSKYLIE